MRRSFVYLVAVVDVASRRALAHRVSITMKAAFCIEALEEALARYGRPAIFNTDQGSQFTGSDFTRVLLEAKISISMDGKGAWRDNVLVERLWRSVKYEEVYLKAYDGVCEAKASMPPIWRSTTSVARIRALTGARPTSLISRLSRRPSPHDRFEILSQLSSRREGLLPRASHRTGHAGPASGSLDRYVRTPARAGSIPAVSSVPSTSL